ncbi:MAG TPA: PPC domain-containing DNA-binding protein [Micromonosporaceae bacterium]
MRVIPLRLDPGTDLKQALQMVVRKEALTAAWLMSCVGSLRQITFRLADVLVAEGEYEIISGAGTLSSTGMHVHLCVADQTGAMIGGHLLGGCLVSSSGTVEVILGVDDNWQFARSAHAETGYDELSISRTA